MKGFPRRKRTEEGHVPRSIRRTLNPETRQGKRRARRISLNRFASIFGFYERGRGLSYYSQLERHFNFNIVGFLRRKASIGKAVVTEIGGSGKTLLKLRRKMGKNKANLKAFNIDLVGWQFAQALRGIKLLKGDVLKTQVPKSDLILSLWGLGYFGHPDYMTRKIAGALVPGGVALLHFNSYNVLSVGFIGLKNWSSFLDSLGSGREKISGCEAKIHKVSKDGINFPAGDYFVMLHKHPMAQ
ncbi:MAG: hypothetical protein HYW05_04420 [Candidatus Diapherotrites archaeon]|nr:hypothetical protein [Candidatus Diapherotrites archaeon]